MAAPTIATAVPYITAVRERCYYACRREEYLEETM